MKNILNALFIPCIAFLTLSIVMSIWGVPNSDKLIGTAITLIVAIAFVYRIMYYDEGKNDKSEDQ